MIQNFEQKRSKKRLLDTDIEKKTCRNLATKRQSRVETEIEREIKEKDIDRKKLKESDVSE